MTMNIELLIEGKGETDDKNVIYKPVIIGDIVWETVLMGSPGKLTFTVLYDDALQLAEGAKVQLKVDGKGVFMGWLFEKETDKSYRFKCTAYDQTRYFKNKETYVFTNKTVSEMITAICKDFNLTTGNVADTGFKIEKKVYDNQTLFDMMNDAIGVTDASMKELFVLYDDFGKITLKNAKEMKSDIIIDETTAQDFKYSSSIDKDTYNKIKLVKPNKDTGKNEVYLLQDDVNIGKWGVLQYYKVLQDGDNGKRLGEKLLTLKNRIMRTLSVDGCFGDISIRAGSSVNAFLNLGEMNTRSLKVMMVCDSVTHRINTNKHTMDLKLFGSREFFAS